MILLHMAHDHSISFPLFAGIIASALHVITGPDHLAAVTPLAIENKKASWKIGISWGGGHLAGMLIIGVLFTLFKDFIPIKEISEYSEQLVGIVLIAIGAWAMYRIFKKQHSHNHPHAHKENNDEIIHIHEHDHNHKQNHTHNHKKAKKQNSFAAFSIGTLHGLAGISHFLLFIPTLSFESSIASIKYLIGFGLGTIVAMTIYALILGIAAAKSQRNHDDNLYKGLRFAGGFFAIIIGIYWVCFI